MLTCFDGLISPSNEKDVPCVYLIMNKLSILGESRGVTREWYAQGDSRARGGIAARSRASRGSPRSPEMESCSQAMCIPLYMIQGGLFV